VLNGGRRTGRDQQVIQHEQTLADYESFEELYEAFEAEMAREINLLFTRLDINYETWAECRPAYLLSSMTYDCLARGRNILDGGARYPDYGGSGVGIPNIGDSLYALKQAVFDEGFCTGQEMLDAMNADFEGHEALRARLTALPKFGQDIPEVDAMTDRVLRSFTDLCHNHTTPLGGHVRPIILGFVWVVSMGLDTGATPDGRKAGTPLAHGLSPQCGSMTGGLTAAINSATRLALDKCGGGAAMMWDLDPSWASVDVVKGVLRSFGSSQGQIFQGNIIDPSLLVEAQANPDAYKDLLVRVGGYSARFVSLSKETQEEIIHRRKFAG
jgi:formate C-acetyltransferase